MEYSMVKQIHLNNTLDFKINYSVFTLPPNMEFLQRNTDCSETELYATF